MELRSVVGDVEAKPNEVGLAGGRGLGVHIIVTHAPMIPADGRGHKPSPSERDDAAPAGSGRRLKAPTARTGPQKKESGPAPSRKLGWVREIGRASCRERV